MAAGDFKQGSNLDGTSLATGQLAPTTEVTIYTVPTGGTSKVSSAWFHNASGSTLASIAVFKTPKIGGVAGTKTRIALISNLGAGDSTPVSELINSVLEAGCIISAQASAVTAANYDLTGVVSS